MTPSSKVVGDLAQYMVSQKLSKEDVIERAEELKLPASVVEFLQGYLGQPHGGFPEPLRSKVLKDLPRVDGRPGESLPACDFAEIRGDLEAEFGPHFITEEHVVSAALYPKVTRDFLRFRDRYGPVDKLDTRTFLVGPDMRKEIRWGSSRRKNSFDFQFSQSKYFGRREGKSIRPRNVRRYSFGRYSS